MAKKQKEPGESVETGMEVEATKGDLGEEDVSKPKVTRLFKISRVRLIKSLSRRV
jgi:hypothetical protein